jgi:hypothetical protein
MMAVVDGLELSVMLHACVGAKELVEVRALVGTIEHS